jgi:hypothetical protein
MDFKGHCYYQIIGEMFAVNQRVSRTIKVSEGKKSKVILYPGQTVPKLKYTDGYWDENGDFVEFNAEIKFTWYICSNGHVTPRNPKDR